MSEETEVKELLRALITEIKAMRRDLHWHKWSATGQSPIWDENGCTCEHFRKTEFDAWECPLHGRVER
jgi:hypothetical protein